jgi:hypothetical protein
MPASRVTERVFMAILQPSLKRGCNHAQQILAGGTGGRLNGQAKVDRLHEVRQRFYIRAEGQVAFGNCTSETCAQFLESSHTLRREFLSQRIVPTRKCAMHPHTGCRRLRTGQQINDPVEQPLGYGARGQLSESLRKINGRFFTAPAKLGSMGRFASTVEFYARYRELRDREVLLCSMVLWREGEIRGEGRIH